MRIPNNQNDDFSKKINGNFNDIENIYFKSIKPFLSTREVNVMLQDGSITNTSTFDPKSVLEFYRSFSKDLKNWDTHEIQLNTDESNRIYCQISTTLDNYIIKGYFGIQFNVLPYYKPDKQVIHIQKELIDLSVKNSASLESVANIGNNTIKQELKNMSLDEMEFEELFERLLQNQELIVKLEDKIKNVERLYPELEGAEKKKSSLFFELDNLVMKVYQVSPILIDYNRQMQGEEGVIVYFDIETKVDGKEKKLNKSVNFENIKSQAKERIAELFKEITSVLSKQHS
jgi:hypothetical protein